jgi:hypothetical protein
MRIPSKNNINKNQMDFKIYISGKVTHEDRETCKNKFAVVEKELRAIGVTTVISPMNLGIPDSWSWEEAMELCLRVLREKANTIVLLDDWKDSKGAKIEFYHANKHRYNIFYANNIVEIAEALVKKPQWIDTSYLEFP